MIATLPKTPPKIFYPERDGKPMGETDIQIKQILNLLFTLSWFYRDDPQVYVAADLLLYYAEGDPKEFVVPDVFVVMGVPKGERRTYRIWEEGRAPHVVFEITSSSTRREDLGSKKVLYADLGVAEYFVFDPTGKDMTPSLLGFRLYGTEYQPISSPLFSESLGLELRVQANRLRLYDPKTKTLLMTAEEEAAGRAASEAEIKRLKAEIERLKGKS
ncbi:MAG: Uma2 family endonuclease [Chloroflexi bacterium]|nr:Uma2 family endonuclease [Chloroflexota bacterium]